MKLKNTNVSTVAVCLRNGRHIVKKTYSRRGAKYWYEELDNLMLLKDYPAQPLLLNFDEKELSFEFCYGGIDYEKYLENTVLINIDGFLKHIKEEIFYLRKVGKRTRGLTVKDVYYYTKKQLDEGVYNQKAKRQIASLINKADKETIYTRYDPEASNFLIDNSGYILSCDFSSFRYAHPLYILSYFVVHLDKPGKSRVKELFPKLREKLFSEFSADKVTVKINLIEVYSSLINAYLKNPLAKGHLEWALRGVFEILNEKFKK